MRQHDNQRDHDYSPYVDWPELAALGPAHGWVGRAEQLPVGRRLRAAADAGDITSMTLAGWLLRWRARDEEAAVYLRRADEAGDVRATLLLAELVGGVWHAQHDVPALAGERGHGYAGAVYYPYRDEWPNGGQALLERAAAGDNAEALMILGRQSQSAGRYPEAAARYRRAADLGLVGGEVRLGQLLARPDTEVTDADPAGTLRHAAESGYLPGIVALTEWLVTQPAYDDAELERWLRAAAEQFHVDSMVTLAGRYAATGRLAEAESWYREALNRATHPYEILETYKALAAVLRDQGRTADVTQVREDASLFIDEFLLNPTDEGELDYVRTIRAEAEAVRFE